MIKSIKWKNHPILGDMVLNFTKPNGSVPNTIVFAGINGSGKTTVLDSISDYFCHNSFSFLDYIKYIINNHNYTASLEYEGIPETILYNQIRSNDRKSRQIIIDDNNKKKVQINNENSLRFFGCSYSRSETDYQSFITKPNSAYDFDSNIHDRGLSNDFTLIKKLLINLDIQDNCDWMRISRTQNPISLEEFDKTSRMHRFKNAFNNFFDELKFAEIVNGSDGSSIIFKKHNKRISIDSLSSGEKQIVNRGASLLKNFKNVSKGVVLIDEPELSMHPKWQNKILDFYKDLFAGCDVQLFIATHSEYVVGSALKDENGLVIMLKEDDNGIVCSRNIVSPYALPNITVAETNYLAFDICSTDYHIELYGYIQRAAKKNSVRCCDRYIMNSNYYDKSIHSFPSNDQNGKLTYTTLPTYVRNCIDHPSPQNTFSEEQLRRSIELLIKIAIDLNNNALNN